MNSRFFDRFLPVRFGLLVAVLTMPTMLYGQAPTITAVVNDASGGAEFSPGVPVRIYFTPIDRLDQST